jgi:hypothetical protein
LPTAKNFARLYRKKKKDECKFGAVVSLAAMTAGMTSMPMLTDLYDSESSTTMKRTESQQTIESIPEVELELEREIDFSSCTEYEDDEFDQKDIKLLSRVTEEEDHSSRDREQHFLDVEDSELELSRLSGKLVFPIRFIPIPEYRYSGHQIQIPAKISRY